MSTGTRTASGLGQIAAPCVVPPPAGVRTRTRVRPTAAEDTALERIGVFLGGGYRQALASRVRLGRATARAQAQGRAEEERRLTALSSSRWAGAVTRTALDTYHLGMPHPGMPNLNAEAPAVRAAIATIGARMDAPVAGRTTAGATGERATAKAVRG